LKKKPVRQFLKKFGVGMRIIKTVVSIYLSIIASLAINGQPTSAALAAFISTRSSNEDSVDTGKIRIFGTMIGAVFSLGFIIIIQIFGIEIFSPGYYIMLSLLLIPTIKTTLWFKIPDATTNACIVVLLTLLNYVREGDPHVRILYRFFDTMIGVAIAVIINMILPYEKPEKDETNPK
jgi:uncharacterized membrane protein YgaE (UPF0421/DUF939 family)